MKVIGIDPGTLTTGYGVVSELRGKKTCHAWGAIRLKSGTSMPSRLKKIADELRVVIKEHKPDILSIEETFIAKDPKAALKLGQARGVIMLVAEENGIPVVEYAPLKIKQTLVGYGRADKNQVKTMVMVNLNIKEDIKPLDASDALAIAITHLNHAVFSRRVAQ